MSFHERYPILILMGLYLGCSLPIFNKIYDTSKIVIDEMFHIPQAQAYCNGQYHVWDPKITTLPGLYLAVQIMSPIFNCSTYFLRLFNLAVSVVNMGLFYVILNIVYGYSGKLNVAMQALNLALLPPLYFFSHVFYTDALSLMFLLLFTISVIKQANCFVTIFAIASICTRQTNVIWVFMIWIQKLIAAVLRAARAFYDKDHFEYKRGKRAYYLNLNNPQKQIYTADDMNIAVKFFSEKKFLILSCDRQFGLDAKHLFHIVLPIFLFILFVLYNGSIVVGDKQAHTMTVNIPQLFYFLLFYGFFGLPFVLSRLMSTLSFMRNNKKMVFWLTLGSFLAVHYNTVVHPYLLADNRHYTFYIWNRWFGKYSEAIYVTIPVYVFLACSLMDNLIHQNCISFLRAYILSLIPGLCFQRLLELRYFIIPYVIARLRFPRPSMWLVTCELVWYVIINAAFFDIFFTKEVMWTDFQEPQRIIW